MTDICGRDRYYHRDLSTRNLLLTAQGKVKICDFGCARKILGESYQSTTISGSPPWMVRISQKMKINLSRWPKSSRKFPCRHQNRSRGRVWRLRLTSFLSARNSLIVDSVLIFLNRCAYVGNFCRHHPLGDCNWKDPTFWSGETVSKVSIMIFFIIATWKCTRELTPENSYQRDDMKSIEKAVAETGLRPRLPGTSLKVP